MAYTYRQKNTQRGTFWKHIFSVFIAGAISKSFVSPLERLKILLQVQPLLNFDKSQNFNGIFQAAQKIYIHQGFTAFWRGNWANIFKIIPSVAMRFTVYDKFKQYALSSQGTYNYAQQFYRRILAGLGTGMISMMFFYPYDVIRVRLSCDMTQFNKPRQYKGVFDCMKKMIMQNGIKSLYSGYFIANLGMAPYLAFSFATYDTLTQIFPQNEINNSNLEIVIKTIGVGTLSGMSASLLTYPLDTIRLQMNGGTGTQKLYIDLKDCVKKIWRQEGVNGYYKGGLVNLIKIIPASAIQFSTYEYLKQNIFE